MSGLLCTEAAYTECLSSSYLTPPQTRAARTHTRSSQTQTKPDSAPSQQSRQQTLTAAAQGLCPVFPAD